MTAGASVTIVPVEEVTAVITAALVNSGATRADAEVQAETLIEGDLRGHPSHGIRRLPVLVDRLRAGLIKTSDEIEAHWRTESVVDIDGRGAFGPVAARAAIEAATSRADTTGVSLATVHNANHIGMLAPYVERMAGSGHLALVLTISEALVHPYGGATAMVGTNPIGIGVPTSTDPFVLDMSTSAVSMGKILDHAARGEPIPLGWAVDVDGEPTTDPVRAVDGALSPFGGAKGYALGLAVEIIVSLLAGSAIGIDVRGTLDAVHESSKGDVFIAVSLDRLGLTGRLPLIDRYLTQVRAAGTRGRPVSVPGDRSRLLRQERLRNGVPLDAAVWAAARAYAYTPTLTEH